MPRAPVALVCFILAASSGPVGAQTVLSTHSGVVHYFEGSVTLDGKVLEAHLGKFATVFSYASMTTAPSG